MTDTNWPESGAYNIDSMAPIGQEFRPNLSGLNVVELLLVDFDQSDGLGAIVRVNIREDTIYGSIVGTSASVSVPNLPYPPSEKVVHFDFDDTVPMVPGNRYVIEIEQLGGGNFGVKDFGGQSNPYPYGRRIALGTPSPDGYYYYDLWFREGISNPPNPPTNLAQFKPDGQTEISVGGTTNEPTVVFKASTKLPPPIWGEIPPNESSNVFGMSLVGNKVKLQIELRRLDEYNGQFLNSFTQESIFVDAGSQATIAVYGLINGNYHWQARTVDESGIASDWVQFGGNAISQPDFTVATLPQTKFLTLPFKDPSIIIQQGWVYNWLNPPPHNGIDYVKQGTSTWLPFDVVAAADGWAMQSEQPRTGADYTYGKFILIRHAIQDASGNDYFTLYAHLGSIRPEIPYQDRHSIDYNYSNSTKWKPVRRGELLGVSGCTGAVESGIHLHFEVQRQVYAQFKTDPYDLNTTRDYYPSYPQYTTCGPYYLWTADPPVSADRIIAKVHSPVELMVYDSQGQITGLQNGEEKNEIPYSTYSEDTVTIFFPSDTYRYEIVGTDEGTYGLDITSVENGNAITFDANNIPTSPNATHQYTIDWQALSQGEEGVTLQMDSDGDGVFENTVIADGELTHDEFILQTETSVDFDPDTLNLKSKGQFVTVYIELPGGFDANQIDISSILLNDSVPALSKPVAIGDHDKDGTADLMVKFERNKVQSIIGTGGKALINITGKVFHNGSRLDFKGDDTIKIVR